MLAAGWFLGEIVLNTHILYWNISLKITARAMLVLVCIVFFSTESRHVHLVKLMKSTFSCEIVVKPT